MENQDNYNNELIYGIHPVLEALEAGKTLDKIFILNTLLSLNKDLKSSITFEEIFFVLNGFLMSPLHL